MAHKNFTKFNKLLFERYASKDILMTYMHVILFKYNFLH